MNEAFSLPPGLRMSRPRDVRFTWRGKLVMALIALLMIGGVSVFVALSAVHRRQLESADLLAHGQSAAAVVLRRWRTGDESRRAMMSYRFEVTGQSFEGQSSVPDRLWQTVGEGSILPVRYASGHPAINHPEGVPADVIPAFVPPVAALALLLPCVLLGLALRRERELLVTGVPAPAVVVSQTRRRTGEGGTQLVIKYEFALPNGDRRRGASHPGRRAPAVGTKICVLYDPERPKRNRPYPLSLVQPD